MTQGSGTVSYTYKNGNVAKITYPNGKSDKFYYDKVGNVVKLRNYNNWRLKMDILQMAYKSLENREFIKFLEGYNEYAIESSQYAPNAGLTDVGKVLARGVYKVYAEHDCIKEEYEQSLICMLDMTEYDVYLVCIYLMNQFYDEKHNLAPFNINKNPILLKLKTEVCKRKEKFLQGIIYPNGCQNKNVWEELERFNRICKEEYGVQLF